MIRVTIELVPATGGPSRILGVAHISNDATGTPHMGNYQVELMKSLEYSSKPGIWKTGRVVGFPRDTKLLGAYDLLYRALAATVGYRNRMVSR